MDRIKPGLEASIIDEQPLIASARRGDQAGYNRLVVAYQDEAYSVAYRLLGCPDAAAEATSAAFLAAFRALQGFRGGSFRTWLLRIVTQACRDQARLRKPGATAAGMDPLQAQIARLPWEQRVALVLADVRGLSYDEIAAVTGASPAACKSRLAQARRGLSDCLASA